VFEKLDFFNQYFTGEIPPIIFRECVTSDKNNFNELAPINGCVRHQFCNYMIRCAARKYKIEPKANISYSESVEKLFENHGDEMSE